MLQNVMKTESHNTHSAYSTVLYHTLLHCTVLYYTVLYCTVPFVCNCTVLLPPAVNQISVNKYIMSYHIIYASVRNVESLNSAYDSCLTRSDVHFFVTVNNTQMTAYTF